MMQWSFAPDRLKMLESVIHEQVQCCKEHGTPFASKDYGFFDKEKVPEGLPLDDVIDAFYFTHLSMGRVMARMVISKLSEMLPEPIALETSQDFEYDDQTGLDLCVSCTAHVLRDRSGTLSWVAIRDLVDDDLADWPEGMAHRLDEWLSEWVKLSGQYGLDIDQCELDQNFIVRPVDPDKVPPVLQ